MTDERDVGVEFGDLSEDLQSVSYPLSTAELLDDYGDRTIQMESGETTVADILGPVGDEEFDGPDEVHQTILTMIGEDAVGRSEYSDRGTSAGQEDQESL